MQRYFIQGGIWYVNIMFQGGTSERWLGLLVGLVAGGPSLRF